MMHGLMHPEDMPEGERVSDKTWLTFLRHHPSLLMLARSLRTEMQ
jgi:hypothetical protein